MKEASSGVQITGLAQHEAWLRHALPPVEELRTNLWSIPVPIPNNPLRYVSAYVFASPGGLTVLDPGWNSEEGWAALCTGISHIGGGIEDVRGVLVTHMHFDHIGLAGRVREASGAWIALHRADRDVIARPDYRDAHVALRKEVEWLRSVGAPAEEAIEALGTVESFERFSNVALPDRLLEDGAIADVPGWSLRAVHTPGHTPGHLCFADEVSGLLFSGDHVLPRITPNISATRFRTGDPLGEFLASLHAVRELRASEVLPAHEWRFIGLAERVDELTLHHAHRLDELLAAVSRYPGSAPWELASLLTWSRPWSEWEGRMRIAAVRETLAHLWRLMTLKQVARSDEAVPTYSLVE